MAPNKEEEKTRQIETLVQLTGLSRPDFGVLTKLNLPNCGLSSLPLCLPEILPNLSVLFMPKNKFEELPSVIGSCPNLQMVSFKDNGMKSIHPDSLQPQLRWLILTGNELTTLPDTIGRCKKLQKLMLSGNRIETLPNSMGACENLELVRLACNQLKEPPMELLQLPNLCWAAFSNNPFLAGIADRHDDNLIVIDDPVLDQEDWPVLGQGAGGVTRKVQWKVDEYVAVKTFAGELTSDGSPQDERTISVVASASQHACLISLLGQTSTGALIMEFLDGYEGLAGPPSMETCSRDVYERKNMSTQNARIIVQGMLQVLTQLHAKGICHGDFYGHNILLQDGDESFRVKLSDFGAAFFYDKAAPYAELVQRIEIRAFGVLVEELYILSGGKEANLSELAKCCRSQIGTFSELCEKFQFTV